MKAIPLREWLQPLRSHIHGWGLFTKADLQKHTMVIEYMGELIRNVVSDKREKDYENRKIGSCYMFRVDKEYIVDATLSGCMARFMNHCCRPNAYAKTITVDDEATGEKVKKIVVFANQVIKAGEEITYDYKFEKEDGSLHCNCGHRNCLVL